MRLFARLSGPVAPAVIVVAAVAGWLATTTAQQPERSRGFKQLLSEINAPGIDRGLRDADAPRPAPTRSSRWVIDARGADVREKRCVRETISDTNVLCRTAATHLADGRILGWFQGRMEWGARALGNRSILADPRRADMRDTINTKIKFREKFRPFAPSTLVEAVDDYFVGAVPDPFMIQVVPVRPDRRSIIPAVTHVDGSGRLHTVDRAANPMYWTLIHEFGQITGVPVLLNTSFNENEPIVLRPAEALDCFLRTDMDVLVMGPHILTKPLASATRPGPADR